MRHLVLTHSDSPVYATWQCAVTDDSLDHSHKRRELEKKKKKSFGVEIFSLFSFLSLFPSLPVCTCPHCTKLFAILSSFLLSFAFYYIFIPLFVQWGDLLWLTPLTIPIKGGNIENPLVLISFSLLFFLSFSRLFPHSLPLCVCMFSLY